MFTDLVGFTALGQINEALSLALIDDQRKLLTPIFNKHGGRVVKTIGDAFLIEFPSALEAVRCAYEIQRAAREYNYSLPLERRIRLRVGIHLGDIVESQGDISGDAVNVASRIEPLAEEGGVCLTRQVYDHVQNKFELPLNSMGIRPLKNVSVAIEVYKMAMPWSKEEPAPISQREKKRIVVLPFVNISQDHSDDYFADGLTEELINKLSEIPDLHVVARTSAMNYKKKDKSILEISRELDVGSVVEGSVRKAGNKIRVAVQLIDALNQDHLWSSSYDKELDDIFAIQSDIASKVSKSLSTKLFPQPQHRDTEDVEAYTLYLRATQLYHEETEPSMREAVALLEQAISKDPKFVRAYASLAHVLGRLCSGGFEEYSSSMIKAEIAARKALELGPNYAESHAAMANINGYLDRFQASISEAEKAIQINPSIPEANIALGINYCIVGKLESGLKAFQKAYEVDPLSYAAGNFVAQVYRVMRREHDALDVLGGLKDLNPRNPGVYVRMSECHMQEGNFSQAQVMLNTARQISPADPTLRVDQAILYAFTGKKSDAENILQEILGEGNESVRLYAQLFIQAALGNLDLAFGALFRQVEIHSWPFLVKSLPIFEELRMDNRFIEFCRKVGIPT